MSTEQQIPSTLPPIPAGPWRRWDGAEMVVVNLAQSPIDGSWNVVYVPRNGKGWEVYVEPAALWASEVKPGVKKYVPGGPSADAIARHTAKNGDGDLNRRIMSTTITAAYKVPNNDQEALQMNAQAGMALGQNLVDLLAHNAKVLRGHVIVSLFMQAMADGEALGSPIVVAPANALPSVNRLPR